MTGALIALVVLGAAGVMMRVRHAPGPVLAVIGREEVHAPTGARIRVQVLNTTKTRGLARRATQLLRDRGFDVVEIGSVSPTVDTTVVLDLSGHPAWATAVAEVMAPARTRARRDSSRYLDVTVLVGSTWRPPAQPLYP
ncbi:MAG TPA: LytR C-terminal domain-containing protein [Gemmatimonadaceae bacterium]|nr:LytR C-terminal domain-containing protein [Gemmatimonadaceae bacterium]